MATKNITLLLVTGIIDKRGLRANVEYHVGIEGPKAYRVHPEDTVRIDHNVRVVMKNTLLTIKGTMFRNTHSCVSFTTWCLPDDVDQAKKIVLAEVVKEAAKIRAEAVEMFKHIPE
jgi:hypothetical protein